MMSIEPLATNFREIWIKIEQFSLKKMSSAKWGPYHFNLNVLMGPVITIQVLPMFGLQWTVGVPGLDYMEQDTKQQPNVKQQITNSFTENKK